MTESAFEKFATGNYDWEHIKDTVAGSPDSDNDRIQYWRNAGRVVPAANATAGFQPNADESQGIVVLNQTIRISGVDTKFFYQLPFSWTLMNGVIGGVGNRGRLADAFRSASGSQPWVDLSWAQQRITVHAVHADYTLSGVIMENIHATRP